VKREQESSFCEIAAADLRVSKLDRLGEGFKQVHSVGPGVEKMGSEDCERHVETKIYRADAWRICSDLNFEFCFNWSEKRPRTHEGLDPHTYDDDQNVIL
jgi:hypothetical protein